MTFSINFSNKPDTHAREHKEALARITIGDFSERLYMPTDYWSKDQYIQQWKSAIRDLLVSDNSRTALITEMNSRPVLGISLNIF